MDAPSRDARGRSAEVVACGCRIPYARHGAGAPVVLLGAAELADSFRAELTYALAARFRVLEPEVPVGAHSAGNGSFGRSSPALTAGRRRATPRRGLVWLVPFLEGLGLLEVGVIAAGSFRTAASTLVLEAPEHVARVVLLDERPRGGSTERRARRREGVAAAREGPAMHDPTVGAATKGAPRILRLCASDADRPELLRRISAFLEGAGAASPA